MILSNQRRTKSTHQTGNIGTGGIHPGDPLKGTKNSLIVKGTTLDYDVLAEILSTCKLDNFVQGVLNDRIGQSGRNIGNRSTLFLCLLDVGVHEHGTTGTEIHRRFCK